VNAAERSSASRSSNRNYRRNQRARRRPIRGSRQALRSSPFAASSTLRCPDRGVEGHRGPSRTSRAVDDLAKENRYSEHDERRALPSVGVDRTSGKRLCRHASMRSKFTSMAIPRSSSTGPKPPPCAESSRGEPRSSRRFRRSRRPHLRQLLIDCEEDRTLRAVLVGMLREADRGQPPA
jgi:hypothetical protein